MTRALSVGIKAYGALRRLFYSDDEKLLALRVRRAVNISNKHTILSDCHQPPDHSNFRWFFVKSGGINV